jgi:hypothetical protein
MRIEMNKEIENCDMCGSKIMNGKCQCGMWINAEQMADCPMKLGMEKFHEMKQFTMTADSPHLGCAVVYFRGDYNDCKKVQRFIYQLKNRPFYE